MEDYNFKNNIFAINYSLNSKRVVLSQSYVKTFVQVYTNALEFCTVECGLKDFKSSDCGTSDKITHFD